MRIFDTLIFLFLFCCFSLMGQETDEEAYPLPEDTTYAWQGEAVPFGNSEGKEESFSICYQGFDRMPGQAERQLLVGTVEVQKKTYQLIGELDNEIDQSYHFYAVNGDGNVIFTLLLGKRGENMEGYIADPEQDEFTGLVALTRKDGTIAPLTIRVPADSSGGVYRSAANTTALFPLYLKVTTTSEDNDGEWSFYSHEENGQQTEIIQGAFEQLKENVFLMPVRAHGAVMGSLRIRFYKGFALAGFDELDVEENELRKYLDLEGIFIKQE